MGKLLIIKEEDATPVTDSSTLDHQNCHELENAILQRHVDKLKLLATFSWKCDVSGPPGGCPYHAHDLMTASDIYGHETTPLHQCVEQGWYEGVIELLNGHMDIDALDIQKQPGGMCLCCTPLMKAAQRGDLCMVKLLEENGADLNRRDPHNNYGSVLMAIISGSPDCVRYLVEAGAEVNIMGSRGSPLLAAVRQYNWPWCGTWEGDTSNSIASVKDNSLKIVSILLENGARVNMYSEKDEQSPLSEAVEHNDTRILKLLLQAGGDPNLQVSKRCYNKTPFTVAIRTGNVEAARLVIQYGADVTIAYKKCRPMGQVVSLVEGALQSSLPMAILLILAGCEVTTISYDLIRTFHSREVICPERADSKLTTAREVRLQHLKELSRMVSQPPCLLQLCRNYLRRCHALYNPKLTNQLPIPRLMQEYVLCSDLW